MSFDEIAAARYSCRAFDPNQPVTDEELDALLEAVRLAPTGKNMQGFHVWVMRSDEAMDKMRSCTRCHWDAPLLVLFGADTAHAFVRREDGCNFAPIDGSIVATHYMLAAASLGLDTCWVGLIDVPRVHELFPETEGYLLVGVFPTGHADPERGGPADLHLLRKSREELVSFL